MRKVHMRFWRKHQLDIPAALTEHVARILDLKLEYQEDTLHTVPRGLVPGTAGNFEVTSFIFDM